MFQDVPGCSGMFHVPGFVDARADCMSKELYFETTQSNRPLVKFIRNYIRNLSGVFSISSLVSISKTSFAALTLLFVQNTLVHVIKRKLHGGLKI